VCRLFLDHLPFIMCQNKRRGGLSPSPEKGWEGGRTALCNLDICSAGRPEKEGKPPKKKVGRKGGEGKKRGRKGVITYLSFPCAEMREQGKRGKAKTCPSSTQRKEEKERGGRKRERELFY